MQVYLAEKPSQGRDLAKVLKCFQKGDGYIGGDGKVVTWGFGHLLAPADPDVYDEKFKTWCMEDLPIIPERWKLTPNPKSKKQLKIVNMFLEKASEVIIATDADREGELIARLILSFAKYKGDVKRLWLSALDEKSIVKALSALKDGQETEPLFWAGLGRQRADWMTGMSYTRAATLLFGGVGNVCSVGRVQTPTLRLIVERDLEIENFVSKDFFTLTARFTQNDNAFDCEWIVPEKARGDDEGRCLDRGIAQAVKEKCTGKDGLIKKYETNKKEQHAPLPLSLSDLQKQANSKYGYDAKKVLSGAQSLYEKHKATTYPRSDCNYLPSSQFDDAIEIIGNLSGIDCYQEITARANPLFKSRCWNDKKVSESSHHAIIPTTLKPNLADFSEIERNLFNLIARHYLAQFMSKYVYNETIVGIVCEGEKFKAKGIVPVELGWKWAFKNDVSKKQSKKKQPPDQELPVLEPELPVHCKAIKLHDRKTTPPAHYTDATLISAMKNCGRKVEDEASRKMLSEVQGIGTEATRADVIETLKARSYVDKKGKSLISTDKARAIIRTLPDRLTNVDITAKWEQMLSDVAKGEVAYKDFIGGIETSLRENILMFRSMRPLAAPSKHSCPKCGRTLVRHKSKKGPGYWWGCSGFREGCKVSMDDADGKPKKREVGELSNIVCPTCQEHNLAKRTSKAGNPYWMCSAYPECKAMFYDNNGQPQLVAANRPEPKKADKPCPRCGSDLYIRESSRGTFLGCSGYPQCKYTQEYQSQ